MSDLIGVSLQMPAQPVEPGRKLDASLTIQNRGSVVDQFRIQIGGVPPEWVQLSANDVPLFPGDQDKVTVSFAPPRSPDSVSGRHKITVWVQSKEHQGQYTAVQDSLQVSNFHSSTLEINPKRASGRKGAEYQLRLSNLGNTPDSYTLSAQDDEQGLNYRFARQSVTLQPGQSANIALTTQVKNSKTFGSAQTHNMSVNAKSAASGEGSMVAAQLTQTVLIPTWVLPIVGLLLMALCAAAVIAGRALLFQPPEVMTFVGASNTAAESDAITVQQGQAVTLRWQVDKGDEVAISPPVGGAMTVPTGQVSFVPENSQVYVLTVTGRGGQTDTAEVRVTVAQPDAPVIVSFAAAAEGDTPGQDITVTEGQTVNLTWEVTNAENIVIDPPVSGDLTLPTGSISASPQSNLAYTLRATNSGGSAAAKVQITIQGLPPTIDTFEANPAVIVQGQEDEIALSWVAPGADSVTVEGIGQFNGAVGTTSVPAPEENTSYRLLATNANGIAEATTEVTVSEIDCTVQSGGLNVRSGPGAGPPPLPEFPTIGTSLQMGDKVQPLSRFQLENGAIWLEIITPSGIKGWVAFQSGTTQFIQCSNLEILDVPEGSSPPTLTPTPSSTPTATPTSTPSATPSLTPTPSHSWEHDLVLRERRAIYHLQLSEPGAIQVEATWSGSQSSLALIINGPGKTNAYSRRDGTSTLQASYTVSQADFNDGDHWRVTIASFGAGTATGSVKITYPNNSSRSSFEHNFAIAPNQGTSISVLALQGPGTIEAQASWTGNPANASLAIGRAGLNQGSAVGNGGSSPIAIDYDVVPAAYNQMDIWLVYVAGLNSVSAEGQMELQYP